MATVHNITTMSDAEVAEVNRKLVKTFAIKLATQIVVLTVITVAADQLSKAVIKKIES